MQSFRARWPGLLAEALIYITGSLSLSFVSSTQLLLYPCSSAVKGRGCWLRSKEGKGRGEAEEGFDGIDESLSFLFLSSTKGARFSSLFEPSKHGTTPLGADTLLSLSLSTSLFYFSLSFSLPFSRHFVGKSTLDSRIDAPLQRSSSYPIRFFLSYIHLALTFPRSYWKIKILSFFLSAFRRENIARRGVTSMDG